MLKELVIKTNQREEIIDITNNLEEIINEAGINSGICVLFVTHTSAGLIINENLDETVRTDVLDTLNTIAPRGGNFKHCHDDNGDSHIKASLINTSINVIINDGQLLFGQWQRVLFCEFDGPRDRKIYIKIVSD